MLEAFDKLVFHSDGGGREGQRLSFTQLMSLVCPSSVPRLPFVCPSSVTHPQPSASSSTDHRRAFIHVMVVSLAVGDATAGVEGYGMKGAV